MAGSSCVAGWRTSGILMSSTSSVSAIANTASLKKAMRSVSRPWANSRCCFCSTVSPECATVGLGSSTPAPYPGPMPVAEDLAAPLRERRLRLVADGIGNGAAAHEHRLLRAARPALPVLNWLGQFAHPLLRVPKLGWITADPRTARALLNDPEHLTLLSEGGVGHLWAQILGDWVYDLFDGPGHHDLRTRSRELFTERTSGAFVERAWGPRLAEARAAFESGEPLDLAELSRILVGRMVTTLLGLPVDESRGDAAYLEIFETGERLAAIALGTTADTELPPEKIALARSIVEQ